MAPHTDLAPEHLTVNTYFNPRVLIDHPQVHAVTAHISQLFVEKWALPVAKCFGDGQQNHQWRQEPPAPHHAINYESLSLVPLPHDTRSSAFDFVG